MKTCTACGYSNPDGHSACLHCGHSLPPAAPLAERDPHHMALLHTFTSEIAAGAALQMLQDHRVPADIVVDDCGGMFPPLQQLKGIRLFVAAKDLPKALKLLADFESAQPLEGTPKT